MNKSLTIFSLEISLENLFHLWTWGLSKKQRFLQIVNEHEINLAALSGIKKCFTACDTPMEKNVNFHTKSSQFGRLAQAGS